MWAQAHHNTYKIVLLDNTTHSQDDQPHKNSLRMLDKAIETLISKYFWAVAIPYTC